MPYTNDELHGRASRREFLSAAGRVIVMVPAGMALGVIACDGGSDECDNEGDVDEQDDRIVYTSKCGSGHTHDFTVMRAVLSEPPDDGLRGQTTSYEGKHSHTVELSADDLAMIASGMTVTKRSSLDAAHRHSFEFFLEGDLP
jgi:hypothetical protein